MTDEKPKARRGFAAMSLERRTEIARLGGLATPPEKRSFARDRDLASMAGREGGKRGHSGGRPRKVKT